MIRLNASRSFDHSVPLEQQEYSLVSRLSGTALVTVFFSYSDGFTGLSIEPASVDSVIPWGEGFR
jgi:hypothetical protein